MSEARDPTPREKLLEPIAHLRTGPIDSGPLAWGDIAGAIGLLALALL